MPGLFTLYTPKPKVSKRTSRVKSSPVPLRMSLQLSCPSNLEGSLRGPFKSFDSNDVFCARWGRSAVLYKIEVIPDRQLDLALLS